MTDYLGQELPQGCMGCFIGTSSYEPPGGMIYSTDNFNVHQDPLIPVQGFLVISPKRHLSQISEMTDAEMQEYGLLLVKIKNALSKTFSTENYTTIQEDRSSHFHTWFFPWTEEILKKSGPSSLNKIRGIMDSCKTKNITDDQAEELKKGIGQIRNCLQNSL